MKSSQSDFSSVWALLLVAMAMAALVPPFTAASDRANVSSKHDYKDALDKCILFFEGMRSGRLPPSQRMTWRKDSALQDGQYMGVDLTGGYYDAGDNIKFGFPLAFTTTMLAWGVIEFGDDMGQEVQHAMEALWWSMDYLLRATSKPNTVYVQVGDPYDDHSCWERPEDMDTARTVYEVNTTAPGSEVAGETAAALAAASIVFRSSNATYADYLLDRSKSVYQFANTYKGSYSNSLGRWVCPFYCDVSGYWDELAWASAWINKASNGTAQDLHRVLSNLGLQMYSTANFASEFGWDNKGAGINYLLFEVQNKAGHQSNDFAEQFACPLLPESPTKSVTYTPGGLIYKIDASNMQNPSALSFILLLYGRYLTSANRTLQCGNVQIPPGRLIDLAKSQVDYILGDNPKGMSYMVGYGDKFPQRIHHRASTLPSMDHHSQKIGCHDGTPYFESPNPNPNLLTGAIVGGPNITDGYDDSRAFFQESEPTTYINAPMVGVFGYFASHA